MLDDITFTLQRFVGLFRQGSSLPWTILLPLVVVALGWPLLQMWLGDERTAFMAAFVLAMALRLALRSDGTIRKIRSQISNRGTVILALIFGPGVMAVLVWVGPPGVWVLVGVE